MDQMYIGRRNVIEAETSVIWRNRYALLHLLLLPGTMHVYDNRTRLSRYHRDEWTNMQII